MEDDDAPPQVSAVTSTAETAPRFSLLRRPKRRPAEDSSEPSQHDVRPTMPCLANSIEFADNDS